MTYQDEIKKLKHTSVKTTSGAEIIVLDTGSTLDAEAVAMLQALHSRSTKGLKGHMKVLEKHGAKDFMKNFYVGYGHKSIGDCGSTTIFIEGVSMLTAKAIQDWPLYSGQESSTRYLDFAKQKFINPVNNNLGEEILENWRSFYIKALPEVKKHIRQQFKKQRDEDEKIYEKAVNARAFDIMRSFLPAGASTNLAWHTNLRQAADKLALLHHHPLPEVRDVATAIEKALQKAHKSSFVHKEHKETESYNDFAMQKAYYHHNKMCPEFKLTKDCIDKKALEERWVKDLFKKRPNSKIELPKWLSTLGTMSFEFQLDFGSFRDLQRHRAIYQRMPLLTMDLHFENWYLNELPNNLKDEAKVLLKSQKTKIKKLTKDKHLQQYYIAMGCKIANKISGNLSALVYTAELRTVRFAHPTVRKIAFRMINALNKQFSKYGLKLYPDTETVRFDSARGKQDITLKK